MLIPEKLQRAKEERMEKLADQIAIARRVLPGAVQVLDARERKVNGDTYIDVDFDVGGRKEKRVTLVKGGVSGELIAVIVDIHRETSLSIVKVNTNMWHGVKSTMYEEEKVFDRPSFDEAAEALKKLIVL